jgi:hypothetical protein
MLELFLAISNVGGQISVSHLRGASDPQQRTRSITGETERLCILKATVSLLLCSFEHKVKVASYSVLPPLHVWYGVSVCADTRFREAANSLSLLL